MTGTPQIAIDMDSAFWGAKWAVYQEGTGTASLTFAHTVVRPNFSAQGIAVLENTLRLNGGTITSAASPAAAALGHDGLAHDADHKVNWQLAPSAPMVTAVAVSSDPGDSSTYNLGDTIRVAVSFSEAVSVTGTPQIAIDMDPAFWGTKWAAYETGSGTATLTFAHTVVQPNYSAQGIAVLENTLRLNGGTITSAASPAAADLAHDGLAHDAGHKVDWQIAPPAEPACELTAPSSVEALTIGQGAVVSWTLPDMDDACDVSGFTITAVNDDPTLGSLANRVTDPDARSHTLRGLDPGDYRFSVSIEYAEGDSEELVTAQANSVPDACMTLAVQPYSHNAISGKIASVNGTGCMARETFEIEIKRTADDFWDTYGRFTYPGRLEDNPFRPAWSIVNPDFANQPDFVFGSREPYVGYDFRIAAYDASGSKYTTNPASATVVAEDPADTADANSPGNVRVWADNNDGLMVTWDAAAVAAGRTLSAYVVEWKTADGTAMTKEIESDSSPSSEFARRLTRITGLTNDVRYTVRVAARTHPNGQSTDTSDAWSVRAPGVRTWSEPTQLWFSERTPSYIIGRVYVYVVSNKNWGNVSCPISSTGGSPNTVNCPINNLVSHAVAGTVTVNANYSLGASASSVGEVGGPHAPVVYASAGAAPSDNDVNTHEGRIAVAWDAAGSTGVVGSIDAYIVQHRSGTSGAWTETIKAAGDRSHTIGSLADGTYQVRVRARSDGNDNNPNTTDTAKLGFTSAILTVKVSAADTGTVSPRVDATLGDSGSFTVHWELPDSGSVPHAWQVRHRLQGTADWTESPELFPRMTRRICAFDGTVQRDDGTCENPRRYEVSGLTGGSVYDLGVRFRNANGWSDWQDWTIRPNN